LKIFNSIQEFSADSRSVLTLGTFDGVHKGHKSILHKLFNASKSSGCESVVLTFFPHPRMVLQQHSDIKLLNTIEEKALLLEQAGVDNLIVHPFDHTFSRLTANEFVADVLVSKLNIAKIIIGHDHRFGRNRTATINDLIHFGHTYGFDVEQITALEIDEVSVSSTKIRVALDAGDIKTANDYLGYPYPLTGTVVQGKQLGRTIGFPTANISIKEDYKLIPHTGVYVVTALIEGRLVKGMMNIGTNPTVGGTTRSIEAHLFDFDEDLYSKKIQVNLHARLRDETKFEGIDQLIEQLKKDRLAAFDYFKNDY
jgi:riboflavin kinase/FMN adenylyltransferase